MRKDIVYSDIKNDISRILKDEDYSDSNKLLEIMINSENFKVYQEFIDILKSYYSNSIDYKYVMTKLFESDNEKINNELIRLLNSNSKKANEDLFIELENENILNNKYNFIKDFCYYQKNEIGSAENIYDLDIDIDSLIDGIDNEYIDLYTFKSFIENKDKSKTALEIINKSKEKIIEDKYDLVEDLLKLNTEKKLDENLVYKEESDKLNEIISLNNERNNLINEVKNLEDEYKNSESFISDKNKKIESLNKEKSNMEKELQTLQTNLDKLKPFNISGYIVGKTQDISDSIGEGEAYEVKYTVDIPYGNSDSVDRFILKTYSTQYTSKGNFTLQVVYDGIQDVSIKEDFGGFNQKWVVYSQYTGKIKSIYENAVKELEELKEDIENKNSEIDNVNKLLNQYNENIKNYNSIKKEKEDKINEIKKSIENKKSDFKQDI